MRSGSGRNRGNGKGALRASPLAFLLLLLGLTLAVANASADNYDERRVRHGARLFRALLAADVGLPQKLGADGKLHLLVYGADAGLAAEIGELIAPRDAGLIQQLSVIVERIEKLPAAEATDATAPVGLFLIEVTPDDEFERLVQWGITNKVIVYSPFEGDVERGAMAGLSIEAKVLPYVNLETLERSGVQLKPFFLKVAKHYR